MGLDITLVKYLNYKDTNRRQKLYESASSKLWKEAGENAPEPVKEKIREKLKKKAEKLNLDEWGSDRTGYETQEFVSIIDPDHLFKVGYFRSSYNEGGINSVLRNFGIPGLYEIFSYDKEDEYAFQPDWEDALKKVNISLELLIGQGAYRVREISSWNNQEECQTSEDALKVFLEEKKKTHPIGGNGYSNGLGEFYINEPIKIYGFVHGMHYNRRCVYAITEGDNSSYITSLKIVKETIEYVLCQPDREKYYLHWSA